jgi:tetratricopeptide (TPR) repeat protein
MVLGRICWSLGNLRAAEYLVEEALKIEKQHWGYKHTQFLSDSIVFAGLMCEMGKAEKAAKTAQIILGVQENKLGATHRDVLETRLILGEAAHRMGNNSQAKELQSEVLTLLRENIGPDDPLSLNAETSLVLTLLDAGDHEEALRLADKSLERCLRVLGPENGQTEQLRRIRDRLVRDK